MLEMVDLGRRISKAEYKKEIEPLERRVAELQRKARSQGVPLVVVFEGWDAAGKGTLINKLLLALDSRGFTVHPINPPNEEEAMRPFLWRFWTRTPQRGRIAIFDRSWYGGVLVERVDKLVKKGVWQHRYGEINAFERQLTDDGFVVVKFFLHISHEEQARRFRKLRKRKVTAWKVTREDWKHHRQYDKYLQATEDMLANTSQVPWYIVEAHDRRFAAVKVFRTVVEALERATARRGKHRAKIVANAPSRTLPPMAGSILDTVDLSQSLDRPRYERLLKHYQKRVLELEHELYLERIPVVIVYEGWDAAGKGGNIRRLVQGLDPRGYQVIPIAAPNDVEKQHHYLWRFWLRFPKAGHIAIFDRSWYGRVLVERVEGFCSREEWKRAYAEINETEQQWTDFGAVLIKFWLHIDKEEQLRRFESRRRIAHKRWKITEEDWRNREKWDAYRAAVDEMLYRTSTTHAPWSIVPATSKLYARVHALRTVVDTLESRVGRS